VDTLMNLPKGTSVFSATDTRSLLADIPRYAWGDKRRDQLKKGYGKKKENTKNTEKALHKGNESLSKWTGEVWDYIKHPSKLLNIALDKMGAIKPEGFDIPARVARGGF